jgi:hypothetical protein
MTRRTKTAKENGTISVYAQSQKVKCAGRNLDDATVINEAISFAAPAVVGFGSQPPDGLLLTSIGWSGCILLGSAFPERGR